MKRFSSVVALVVTVGLVFAGCGSNSLSTESSSSSSGKAVAVDSKLAEKLPKKIKDAKKIVIGTNATYAPMEMMAGDGKTPEGVDIELFNAVFAKFGVKTEWQSAEFETLIAGVSAGKFDVSASAFTIEPKRLEVANMVSYFSAGVRWGVQQGNPKQFDYKNPCGKTVSVQAETIEDSEIIPAADKECEAKGKPKLNKLPFKGHDEAAAAVATGRADAFVADSPVTDFNVKMSGGKLETQGEMYKATPYGIVVPKNDEAFAKAIAEALKQIKAEGKYDEILNRFGVQSGAVPIFEVNPKA